MELVLSFKNTTKSGVTGVSSFLTGVTNPVSESQNQQTNERRQYEI